MEACRCGSELSVERPYVLMCKRGGGGGGGVFRLVVAEEGRELRLVQQR